jgi:hypothetical protein
MLGSNFNSSATSAKSCVSDFVKFVLFLLGLSSWRDHIIAGVTAAFKVRWRSGIAMYRLASSHVCFAARRPWVPELVTNRHRLYGALEGVIMVNQVSRERWIVAVSGTPSPTGFTQAGRV